MQYDSVYTCIGSRDCASQLVPAVDIQSRHQGPLHPRTSHHSSYRHTLLAAQARASMQPSKPIDTLSQLHLHQPVAHISRAIQSGASRSAGLQENELGGIDFVIRPLRCDGTNDAEPEAKSESETNHDIPRSRIETERSAFQLFFGDGVSLHDVRFNSGPKVTKSARHCPRHHMVHKNRTPRQPIPQLFRAGQLDPSVCVRAFDSELALTTLSCVVI